MIRETDKKKLQRELEDWLQEHQNQLHRWIAKKEGGRFVLSFDAELQPGVYAAAGVPRSHTILYSFPVQSEIRRAWNLNASQSFHLDEDIWAAVLSAIPDQIRAAVDDA
ncbi:MAG: hypothetical protein KDK39_02940 [Leptospiraceae bacterium]|nr:hypothetical protein [Leptospiraceae bacterium]